MENLIPFSIINDFIFCPVSIYFHSLYGGLDNMLFQCEDQIDGSNAHEALESGRYSSRKNILQAISVCCEKYNLQGKIDQFDSIKGLLTERKRKVSVIYDGYVFQLYAQYFSLLEMGYNVNKLQIYSMEDNKVHPILIPEKNPDMLKKFEETIVQIQTFNLSSFQQINAEKCKRCIYEPACDRTLA